MKTRKKYVVKRKTKESFKGADWKRLDMDYEVAVLRLMMVSDWNMNVAGQILSSIIISGQRSALIHTRVALIHTRVI